MSKLFRGASVLGILAVGLLASKSFAAPLGLISAPPDVTSIAVTMTYTYNSTTHVGEFEADGMASQLHLPAVSGITGGVFHLDVFLSATGPIGATTETVVPTSTAVLSVTGNGGTDFFSSHSLTQFGFSTMGGTDQTFEFVFAPEAGSVYGATNSIGVIIAAHGVTGVSAPYSTNFMEGSFNSLSLTSGSGADTYAVPLPSAFYSGLIGLAVLPLFMRRRRVA